MDRVLVQRTIDMLNTVSQARQQRETAINNTTHTITYSILTLMGLVTLIGVKLLQVCAAPCIVYPVSHPVPCTLRRVSLSVRCSVSLTLNHPSPRPVVPKPKTASQNSKLSSARGP